MYARPYYVIRGDDEDTQVPLTRAQFDNVLFDKGCGGLWTSPDSKCLYTGVVNLKDGVLVGRSWVVISLRWTLEVPRQHPPPGRGGG